MNKHGGIENSSAQLPRLAIVGMGCLFPKADNLTAYWANIREGVDAITEIPATHWRPEDYFSSDPKTPDHTYGRRGGFLEPYPFNPMAFGMPPSTLEGTDSSQLLGMVAAQQAMEDAGYGASRSFNRDRVSVILGVTGAMELVIPLGARLGHPVWRKAMQEAGVPSHQIEEAVQRISDAYVPWQEASFPGLLGNVVAGRVSKHLDLGGTNCVVDAACASALSAVHLAAMELSTGHADMVITGGVDTFNDIFMYMCFSKTPALSPTGDSKPFDSNGDGTILGEGLGVVVLKRLEDAERDGDRIYAVIRGIGSSSDGKGDAIYAPSAAGQQEALESTYSIAGVTPDTIELLEAHGTGTKVGDAVEARALKAVYGATDRAGAWCALGSVKSQIGHTKAAAGAAGLIKATLALHHKVLPPTIKVKQPLPEVAPGTSPFYVNTEKRPWAANPAHPRRAAVSAFGFGGSNFHCVLEEHTGSKTAPDWDGEVQVIALSAHSKPDLKQQLGALPAHGDWNSWRAAGQRSRAAFDATHAHRLVMVIERHQLDAPALLEAAGAALDTDRASWGLSEGAWYGSGKAEGALAMVFPGQGAQYVGMLRDLVCLFPEALDTLAQANRTVAGLSEFIYPQPAFDDATRKAQESALRATEVAQPALGAVSLAALRVLARFGVRPAHAAGHSYGELTALAAATCLNSQDLFTLSRARGELMAAGSGERGTMAAVQAPVEAVEALLPQDGSVVIANKNAPNQTVVSGATAAVDQFLAQCKANKLRGVKLQVAGAFHSAFVADAQGPLRAVLDACAWETGAIPVYSNTTGDVYPGNPEAARDLLASQMARPVEFVDEIRAMHAAGARTFVEVGPGQRLSGLIAQILDGEAFATAALDASNGKSPGIADLARCLAHVAARGHEIDLTAWDDAYTPPAQTEKPQFTVPICGANYRTPNQRPRPKAAPPAQALADPEVQTADPVPHPAPKPPAPAPHLALLQQNLATLQQLQEQTAELHKQYLEGQDAAARTLQMLMTQQQQMLGLGSAQAGVWSPEETSPRPPSKGEEETSPRPFSKGEVEPSPLVEDHPSVPDAPAAGAASEPVVADSGGVAALLLAIVSEKTGYPEDMLALEMSLDADLGIDSIKRVEILSALQEALPDAPAIEADEIGSLQTVGDIVARLQALPSTPSAPTPGSRVMAVLLGIVAEKTGYPREMLDPGMSLDADLGIDSIKRVEILSALQEELPDLPPIEADELGTIRTLADISARLGAAAPASPAPVEDTSSQVAPVLLKIVADKTGYPQEMLKLGMSLDSDLGIDSIKRVEILSALQDLLPNLPAIEADQLGVLRTLGDIVQELEMTAPVECAVKGTAAAVCGMPNAKCLHEFSPRVERSMLQAVGLHRSDPRGAALLGDEATIWILDDGALALSLQERLRALEYRAEVLALEDGLTREVPETLAGLFVLAPQRADGDAFLRNAFALVQRTGETLVHAAAGGQALLVTVARMDGQFGLGESLSHDPWSGGLGGLAKTAGQEWPKVCCKSFDVAATAEPVDVSDAVIDEALYGSEQEVGFTRDGRFGMRLQAHALEDAAYTPLTRGDVVIVSGGARGVTAEVCVALARAFQPALCLLGRSPEPGAEPEWLAGLHDEKAIKQGIVAHAPDKLSPKKLEAQYQKIKTAREIRETLGRIREAGATASYHAVDVRDAAAVAALAGQLRETGPIRGVIHGAGVLADRLIADKTLAQFDEVYETKVRGLRALLEATRTDGLSVLVLFSSSTARFGRKGQVDYAMANEILNKTAHAEARRRPECRVVALNWGPWNGGMVTPALRKLFDAEGVGVIELEHGAAHLVKELQATPGAGVEVVVLGAGTQQPKAPIAPVAELECVLEFELDVERFPFLSSHVMDGCAVLPMAMYIEWFAHAALHNHPGMRFVGANDVRVLKGVIMNGAPVRVRVFAGRPRQEDGQELVPVEFRSVGEDREIVHARGEVVLAMEYPRSTPRLAMHTNDGYPDAVYGTGRLFHGPALQGIVEVAAYGVDGIAVRVQHSPAPARWIAEPVRATWLADPFVLDCGFQALVLWACERHGMPCLPCFFGRYRQFKPRFPRTEVMVTASIIHDGPQRAVAVVEFLDATSGELIARMDDSEHVLDRSLNAAFQRNQLVAIDN
jgi:acyl transferase domain-containing protein